MRTLGYLVAATTALAFTAPTTALAYRTTADTEGFDPLQPVRWRQTVRWRVDPAGIDGIPFEAVEGIVEEAWRQVDRVTCASIGHERLAPSSDTVATDGIVTVRGLGDGWVERGYPSDAAGRTELVYQRTELGWTIVDADVFLNSGGFDLTTAATSGATRALLPIILHELLHAVGMEHCCGRLEGAPECISDSLCASSTMYPLYSPATQSVVGPDDAAGLCWLYPHDACIGVSCAVGEACAMGVCREVPRGCTSATECNTDENCTAGVCTRIVGSFGDPCVMTTDCALDACELGRCTATCGVTGALCAPGYECDGRLCRPFLAELGERCVSSADCAGQECLSGADDAPVCTRACGSSCPRSWSCVEVEGEQVCRPPFRSDCSARAGVGRPWSPLVLLIVALLARARRSRR